MHQYQQNQQQQQQQQQQYGDFGGQQAQGTGILQAAAASEMGGRGWNTNAPTFTPNIGGGGGGLPGMGGGGNNSYPGGMGGGPGLPGMVRQPRAKKK